jgi:hypothetical protein
MVAYTLDASGLDLGMLSGVLFAYNCVPFHRARKVPLDLDESARDELRKRLVSAKGTLFREPVSTRIQSDEDLQLHVTHYAKREDFMDVAHRLRQLTSETP